MEEFIKRLLEDGEEIELSCLNIRYDNTIYDIVITSYRFLGFCNKNLIHNVFLESIQGASYKNNKLVFKLKDGSYVVISNEYLRYVTMGAYFNLVPVILKCIEK